MPAARRLVRSYLREHGLEVLVPDAELLVAELVGNVVLHVGGEVGVVAVAGADQVLIEVTDSSAAVPLLRVFSPTSSTGRGMRLVHSLAVEHGVRAGEPGKTVWVLLTTSTAGRSDDALADSFADLDWLAGLDEPEVAAGSGTQTDTGPDAPDRMASLARQLLAPRLRLRPVA